MATDRSPDRLKLKVQALVEGRYPRNRTGARLGVGARSQHESCALQPDVSDQHVQLVNCLVPDRKAPDGDCLAVNEDVSTELAATLG